MTPGRIAFTALYFGALGLLLVFGEGDVAADWLDYSVAVWAAVGVWWGLVRKN